MSKLYDDFIQYDLHTALNHLLPNAQAITLTPNISTAKEAMTLLLTKDIDYIAYNPIAHQIAINYYNLIESKLNQPSIMRIGSIKRLTSPVRITTTHKIYFTARGNNDSAHHNPDFYHNHITAIFIKVAL